jgi:aspartate aminotransferase
MLSKRVSHIKPAPTLALSAKVNQLKSQGFDVVGFGAGEPDFDTPDFIKEACMKALKEGENQIQPLRWNTSPKTSLSRKATKGEQS